jgi:hypothetical protein
MPGRVRPIERHGEKEPQRRDGGVDNRRAPAVLGQVQLKTTEIKRTCRWIVALCNRYRRDGIVWLAPPSFSSKGILGAGSTKPAHPVLPAYPSPAESRVHRPPNPGVPMQLLRSNRASNCCLPNKVSEPCCSGPKRQSAHLVLFTNVLFVTKRAVPVAVVKQVDAVAVAAAEPQRPD